MWLEVAADLLMPKRDNEDIERAALARPSEKKLAVPFGRPGAFAQRLNESGWLADEVVAGGVLAQGKTPSMLAMVTGAALVDVLRPRASKALPREFVLAVSAERVTAFALSAFSEGDETETVVVYIKPGELGSWARAAVRLGEAPNGKAEDGVLELPGLEPMPVTWGNNPSTSELVKLLGR